LQIAVQANRGEAAAQHTILEIRSRIKLVLEPVGPRFAPGARDGPLEVHARPVLIHAGLLDQDYTIGKAGTLFVQSLADHTLFAHHVHDQRSASPQTPRDVSKDAQVVLFLFKVTERSEEIAGQIKGRGPVEPAATITSSSARGASEMRVVIV